MVLQACCSKAVAFLFLALFGGGLEIAFFVAFFRFWKIAEQRVLFYYMPAYGATLSPASSVLRLLPLAGPLGEPLRQFWGPARNLYCQGQPRIGVYLGRVGPLVGPWRNRSLGDTAPDRRGRRPKTVVEDLPLGDTAPGRRGRRPKAVGARTTLYVKSAWGQPQVKGGKCTGIHSS